MEVVIGLVVGFVIGILFIVLLGRAADAVERQPGAHHTPVLGREAEKEADDWQPPPPRRRERDLFTLVVGIALGAAIFGDDDE